MSVVEPSSGDVPEIPNGLYLATIASVKDIELDTPDKFGKTAKVEISVEFDVDGEIQTLDPRVNRAWSEKATLFLIAQAAGLDPDPFEPFDTDLLLDRQVNILTDQEEGKWPRVKTWSRVQSRKAAKPAQKPAGEAPARSTSVVNPDGTPNYDAFWRVVKGLGLNNGHVYDKAGGMDAFMDLDGADVGFLLEELKLQIETAV